LQKLESLALDSYELAVNYFGQTYIWVQVAIIALAVVPALVLSRALQPWLVARARSIRRMRTLLRIVVAILHRLGWFFISVFLSAAYIATDIVAWPEGNTLLYAAAALSGAWFIIGVIAQAIRGRTFRKVFNILAWVYAAMVILGVADDVALALDSTGFKVGQEGGISILDVLQTVVLLAIALWAASSVGNFLDRRIQTVDELTPSLRVLLGKIVRISLVITAGVAVVSGMGINLTALTVLSGAVGVGIGFGLQKVVSNFISGIIILLDQSIKPGDTITLGETFGWIRELRARFVSVVTRDGREFLIPNEDFITTQVVNWSFTDKFVRLDVDFGVSYDSDPHEVVRLAIEAASSVSRVESVTKRPVCWMTEFGDSSLNFKLRFWISDPQQGLTNIRGMVMLALWDAFKENGIDIPFPHREIIMRTPVELKPASDGVSD